MERTARTRPIVDQFGIFPMSQAPVSGHSNIRHGFLNSCPPVTGVLRAMPPGVCAQRLPCAGHQFVRVACPSSYAHPKNTMKALKSKIAKKVNKIFKDGNSKATGDTGSIDPPSRTQSSLAIGPSELTPPTLERRKSDSKHTGLLLHSHRFSDVRFGCNSWSSASLGRPARFRPPSFRLQCQ